MSNTTISGNRANMHGGGLSVSNGGDGVLRSVTIAGNTSDFDSDGGGSGGGLRLESAVGWRIENSILADNADNTVAPEPDCSNVSSAPLATSFNHVESVPGGCDFTGTGNTIGTDPGLAVLAANGGSTLTHALTEGSPVLDAGDPAGCLDALSANQPFDQRGEGFARVNGLCDKGAFEFFTDVVFADGLEDGQP